MIKEISAKELESVCRKSVRVEVSDVKILSRVLDSMKIEYNILSDTHADIYAQMEVSQLVLALSKENCAVFTMQERDESLESYYVNLVGGVSHE